MPGSSDNSDRIRSQPTFLHGRLVATIGDWMRTHARRRLERRIARVVARPIVGASMQFHVEWHAAGVHPWDEDIPAERQAHLFTARLLDDTVVRIHRMFTEFTELDSLHVRVLAPTPDGGTLLKGTISRAALQACQGCRSAAMSLKLLGVDYRLRDGRLEPLA